jgi:hypothetical protein
MARLIYSAIMSLDGYIADAHGQFEWAALALAQEHTFGGGTIYLRYHPA